MKIIKEYCDFCKNELTPIFSRCLTRNRSPIRIPSYFYCLECGDMFRRTGRKLYILNEVKE